MTLTPARAERRPHPVAARGARHCTIGWRRHHPRVVALHRYYDPATGQFLSRDPLVATTDAPYSYVDDSPLNGADPSGLCVAGLFGKHCHIAKTLAAVGTGLAVAGLVVGAVAAPEIVLPLVGTVGTEGLSLGLGAAALTIGVGVTLRDCMNAVDAQCAIEGIGDAAGLAGLVGGALFSSIGHFAALEGAGHAGEELLQYARQFSNLGLGGFAAAFGAAALFAKRLGLNGCPTN